MPISTYVIPTATVPLGKNNSFTVRAISFPDLTFMVQRRMPELIAIIAKYGEMQGDMLDKRNTIDMLTMIARDFPSFAVEIISMCVTGEEINEELEAKVSQFGFPIQLTALLKIAQITVEEAGGLKNLIADFQAKLVQLRAEMGDLGPQTTLQNN